VVHQRTVSVNTSSRPNTTFTNTQSDVAKPCDTGDQKIAQAMLHSNTRPFGCLYACKSITFMKGSDQNTEKNSSIKLIPLVGRVDACYESRFWASGQTQSRFGFDLCIMGFPDTAQSQVVRSVYESVRTRYLKRRAAPHFWDVRRTRISPGPDTLADKTDTSPTRHEINEDGIERPPKFILVLIRCSCIVELRGHPSWSRHILSGRVTKRARRTQTRVGHRGDRNFCALPCQSKQDGGNDGLADNEEELC
jgi:hypothetical protein